MTLKQIPWAMTNAGAATNPAERVRQAHQSHVGGTGVENSAALAVTALATPNMSVNVAAGGVWIAGTLGSTTSQSANASAQTTYGAPATFTSQGSYYDYNDATVNLPIAAANATNPRIDLVVATVQDADYSGTANQAILQVITGTPASSPVAPPVPASSLVLAQIAVAANATTITAGNITDTRPVSGFGGWTAWTPTYSSCDIASVAVARYKQIGKTVFFRFVFTVSGSSSTATFSLPVPALDYNHMFAATAMATAKPVGAQTSDTAHGLVSGLSGIGGQVFVSGTYEAA